MYKQSYFKNNEKYDSTLRKTNYPQTSLRTSNTRLNNPELTQTRKSFVPSSTARQNAAKVGQRKESIINSRQPLVNSRLQKYRKQSLDKRASFKETKPATQKSNHQRAPSNQFKRYLDDAQNVFWQNSWQLRKLKIIRFLKLCLMILFFILSTSYILIRGIQPWPQAQCPPHADCGVFVHCKKGYIRQNNLCYLDPAIKDRAKSILNAVIQQLKLDYGARDCQTDNFEAPTKGTVSIFSEFKVDDQVLKNQIYELLQDDQNKVNLKFNYHKFTITPTEKLHPLTCKIQLFAATTQFNILISALLISMLILAKWLNHCQLKRKANSAYNYLRQECFNHDYVLIQEHKAQIRKILGEWNEELWQEIDKLRYQQRIIVYFEESDQLYWKRFGESRRHYD